MPGATVVGVVFELKGYDTSVVWPNTGKAANAASVIANSDRFILVLVSKPYLSNSASLCFGRTTLKPTSSTTLESADLNTVSDLNRHQILADDEWTAVCLPSAGH